MLAAPIKRLRSRFLESHLYKFKTYKFNKFDKFETYCYTQREDRMLLILLCASGFATPVFF